MTTYSRTTPVFLAAPVVAAILAIGMAGARAQQPAASNLANLTVQALPDPAAPDSVEPQFANEGGRTILSWLELRGKHTMLRFSERTGSGWTTVRTAAEGDDFMVNTADVPSVHALASGELVAQWLQQDGPDPESYKLRLSWSKDGGRSWSPSSSPHRDSVQTQHGFASLFQVPGAGLGLVWLDGRSIPPDASEGVGNMALRAAIFGSDGRQRDDSVVAARVCECCQTAAATTADGVIVAYRNRSASEIRDIYVTRFENGKWTAPTAVHNDGWRIKGCPINGPAISARARDVVVAWFTAKGEIGHVFAAFSHDAGRTFGAPVRVDEQSALGRVGVVLLPDGSAATTWVEAGRTPQFKVRLVNPLGKIGAAVRVADSSGTRYPRVTLQGADLLFAWSATEGDSPHVRTARASVPVSAK